jgi:hypothetical protein
MGPFATFVLVTVYFKEIILAVVFILTLAILARAYELRSERNDKKRVNDTMIGIDADHQNLLYLQGDPVGVYGNYDAYTMPMTKDILDDHDDGMQQWA